MKRKIHTYFGKLLNHIDQYAVGEKITRKSLLEAVYGKDYPREGCTTVDKWKRQLIVCGYLEETEKRGIYKKGWNIPPCLTTGWLERAYTRINTRAV